LFSKNQPKALPEVPLRDKMALGERPLSANERMGVFCPFILWRVLRGDHGLKIGLRTGTKSKNLATFAISSDAEQDLVLSISALPAGALWVKIGGTTGIDIF